MFSEFHFVCIVQSCFSHKSYNINSSQKYNQNYLLHNTFWFPSSIQKSTLAISAFFTLNLYSVHSYVKFLSWLSALVAEKQPWNCTVTPEYTQIHYFRVENVNTIIYWIILQYCELWNLGFCLPGIFTSPNNFPHCYIT